MANVCFVRPAKDRPEGDAGLASPSVFDEAGLLEAALQSEKGGRAARVDGAPEVAGFEIISRLGAGSSGEVWLAEELETGTHRGIENPASPRCGASEEVLQREFRILAKLIHPNLVLLYHGIVTADGRQGLAMEWIDGWPWMNGCSSIRI